MLKKAPVNRINVDGLLFDGFSEIELDIVLELELELSELLEDLQASGHVRALFLAAKGYPQTLEVLLFDQLVRQQMRVGHMAQQVKDLDHQLLQKTKASVSLDQEN